MGAGMPSVPTDAITETAKATMTTFIPYYIKGYATALIKELHEEAEAVPSQLQLLDYELPKAPLKLGLLTKQGIIRKSWKERFFVAFNAADNYVVHYYVNQAAYEANPDKPKGKIQMCNLRVKRIKTEEELAEFGENCLKLKPYGRRRTWYIRCPDADTLKAWKPVFKYASRYAQPPLNKDKCMRKAFELAYQMTRWDLDVWSWYRYDQSEEEMLGQLVSDKCEQSIMEEVYAKIPTGTMYWKIRGMVEKTLDTTVGAVVGGMWKTTEAGVEASRDTLKATAKAATGDLFAKEAELQATIRTSLASVLAPHTAKIGEVIAPAVIALAKPLYKAYRVAIKIFIAEMNKALAGGKFDEDVERFNYEIRWYYGVMFNAYVRIRALTRPDSVDGEVVRKMGIGINIADVLSAFGDISLWSIEDKFESNIKELMFKAVWTLKQEIKDGVPPPVAVASTARKYIHDAKLVGREQVHFLFFDLVHTAVHKLVKEPVAKLVEPLQAMVPSALEPLLSPRDIASDTLKGVISDAINAVIAPGCAEQFNKLDKLRGKLSLD